MQQTLVAGGVFYRTQTVSLVPARFSRLFLVFASRAFFANDRSHSLATERNAMSWQCNTTVGVTWAGKNLFKDLGFRPTGSKGWVGAAQSTNDSVVQGRTRVRHHFAWIAVQVCTGSKHFFFCASERTGEA